MFDLTGKTALVTGATGGIGAEIAKALHAQGAHVVLSGTREAVLQELAAALGERVSVAAANLSDSAAVDGLIEASEAAAGAPVDILVANAGITKDGLLLRMKDEDWERVLKVNLESYFRLSRAAMRGMMKRRFGRIIGITSVVGVTGNPGQANYAASKAGMIGFSKALAQSLGLSPIKVDHIIKGYTGTIGMYAIDTIDMVMDQFGDSPKPTKRFEQLPVIKRFASDPEARGYVTQYYELKDAVDTTVRTMNLLEKTNQPEEYMDYIRKNQGTLAFKDYVNDTERALKELREIKVSIRASTMSGDEKRDVLLSISQMESAITSNIQEIKKTIARYQ